MKKNVFTKLNFTVSGFCGSKRRRRFIALLSLFGMLIGSTASAIVIPPFSGEVLPEVNGNGGAFITGTTEYIEVVPAGAGNNASISLVNGFNAGLINWSALSIGQGQSISFIGNKFFNVVEGTKASEIAGTLNANGSVWIFNPAGISFIDGAQVNVGGLFSAVAAGLANKDEMAVAIDNTGTVMDDPVLDNTVVGKIAVENGVVFGGAEYDNGAWTTTDKVGNGVVLAGKSVTVEDGVKFNANNVTLAAGGKLVIDEVNDGKVTFNIDEFAGDVTDIFVSFQDADSSDATGVSTTGDLDVFTEGAVKVYEAVKADGSVYISGAQKPSGSAPVIGVKQMTVASGKLIQGKSVSAFSAGKITADGGVKATGGDMTLEAIEAIELYGDVTASGNLSLAGADTTMKGNVSVANIDAGTTKLTVDGADVDVTGNIAAGTLDVDAGTVDAATVAANVVQDGGTVTVTDTVTGNVTQNDGTLSAVNEIAGNVTQVKGDITAAKIDGELTQSADGTLTAKEVTEAATVAGTVNGDGELKFGSTLTQNGGAIDAKGDLTLEADATVKGDVDAVNVVAGDKTLTVDGADVDVTGNIAAGTLDVDAGTVDAATVAANVVQDGGEIKVDNDVIGYVVQYGGKFAGGTISGYVTQNNSDGTASIVVDKIGVTLNQDSANKANVTVSTVGGDISQNGSGKIIAKDGNITVSGNVTQYGGSIESTGNATFNGVLSQESGTGVIEVNGTLTLNGGANQSSSDSSVTAGKIILNEVTAGYQQYNLTSSKNDFDQVEASVGYNPLSIVDKDGLELGSVETSGKLAVSVVDGSITQTAGTTIDARDSTELTAEKGDITLEGDNDFASVSATAKNVTINDNKNKITLGSVTATEGILKVSAVGDVTVDYGKEVFAEDIVQITSHSGDVNVLGSGAAVLGINKVEISAGSGKTITINEGGAVSADNKITLTSDTIVAGELATDRASSGNNIAADGVTITVDGSSANVGADTIKAAELNVNNGTLLGKKFEAKINQTGGKIGETGVDIEITGALDQDAGRIDAATLTLGADSTVAGTVNAGKIDAAGNTLTQDGGTVTVAGAVTGNVTQKGAAMDSFTAASVSGNVTQESGNLATVTTGSIGGNLEQNGGKVVAQGDALAVAGTTTQNGGGIGDANDAITLNGKLTQNVGTVSAKTLTLKGGAEQTGGNVVAETLILNNSAADVSLTSADNDFDTVKGTAKTLTVNDTDDLTLLDTKVTVGDLKAIADETITIDGVVEATGGGVLAKGASVTVNADKSVAADGNIRIEATGSAGAVELNGSVEGANVSVLALNGGSVSQNATITATAADGFVDVEAGGVLNMAAGTTTEAKTIVYQGTGGTVSGKFEGNVSIAGIGVGGGAEMAGDKVVMDVSSLGSSGNAVKLNASEISINATGDIYVKNSKAVTVKAHAGAAGITVSRVQDDLSVANAGTMATSDIEGIISQNGNVSLVNEGNVTVGSGAGVIAKGGTVDVDASGDVTVAGEVWGKTGVTVDGANVTVNGGTVKAGKFTVNMATGEMDVDTVGNLTLEAGNKVEVTGGAQVGASGDATVTANGADGISVEGSYLVANESLTVKTTAENGSVTVAGGAYVGANAKDDGDKVSVTAENGKVVIEGDATVASRRDVDIEAKTGIKVDGSATKVGADNTVKLTATAEDASVEITDASVLGAESVNIESTHGGVTVSGGKVLAGKNDLTTGEPEFFYAGKTLDVKAEKGVTIKDSSVVGASGDVKIVGGTSVSVSGSLVKAGEYKNLDMTTGELDVDHEGDLTLTADKIDVNGKANVIATGTVDVDAKAGGVTVTGADTKLAANGAMNIDAEGGAVKVSGKAFVGGNSTVSVGAAGNTASAEIDGATLAAKDALDVTAKDSVLVTGADAKVASDKALTLKATDAAGTVTVESGAEAHGKTGVAFEANDITVDNALVKAGKFSVDASGNVTSESDGNLTMTAGKGVTLQNNAMVGASGEATVTANDGNVTVTASKLAANKALTVSAADADSSADDGSISVTGGSFVGGNDTATLTAAKDVTVNASEVAAVGDVSVKATAGKVEVLGTDAKIGSNAEVVISAGTDVDVQTGTKVWAGTAVDVDASGDVTVAGEVWGKTGVTVDGADVTVDGGTVKATTGDVTVGTDAATRIGGTFTAQNGATVKADAGSVKVYATGDADIQKGAGTRTEVSGMAGVTLDAAGAVTVDGGVVKAGVIDEATYAVSGNPAALTMTAGKGVTLQNNATVGASGEATVTANDGNVTVTASKLAANKALTVSAADADSSADDGSISVAGGSFVGGNDTATLTAAKDVTVNASEVAAVGDVSVTATGGKVEVLGTDAKIGSNAKVTLDAGTSVTVGAGAEVLAETVIDIDADDDVTVAGTVRAKGADGTDKALDIQAYDNVEVSGTVEATAGSVAVNADGTDDSDGVKVTGSVTGAKGVMMTADKDVLVGGGTVKAATGDVTVGTDAATRIGGTFTAQNGATVKADAGSVKVYATGDADIQKGTGTRTEVSGMVGVTLDAAGAVTVDGGVVKAGVIDEATYAVSGNPAALTMTAGKGVTLQNNAMVGASGEATVTANDGNVTVTASKLAANKALKVTAENTDGLNDDGSISVAGGSFVGGNDTATLTAAKDVTVNASEVAAVGDVSVKATAGKVEVLGTDAKIGSNAKVTLDAGTSVTVGAGAEVLAETVIDIDADDDVTVAGTVRAKGADGTDKALDIQADDNVEVSGTVEATAGSVAVNAGGTDDGDGVKVTGSVTGATGVAMTADKDVLVDDGTIKATAGTVEMAAKNAISVTGTAAVEAGTLVKMTSTVEGNITIDTANGVKSENVEVDATKGNVVANSGTVDARGGSLKITAVDGNINLTGGKVLAEDADFTASGAIYADNGENDFTGTMTAEGSSVALKDADGVNLGNVTATGATGDVLVETVAGDITVNDGATVQGNVTELSAKDSVKVNGTVSGTDIALVSAQGGNVEFDADGAVEGDTVTVEASGNITQADASVTVDGSGYANDQQLHAAVKANSANLIAGGSIGDAEQGTSDYVGVEAGSVAAEAGIDAAIAGANGSDINVDCVTAGADVSLFTTGTIRPNGTVTAGGDLTVSAKDFSGGAVKMNMKNALTVNNFQSGDKPLIAFFETNGGNKNPEINNQPNETIIFIDGRLAGGDIQAINLLGAVEAFPVQTPELKSEQGIFGNPLFLHDDLDVATPLAVGAIDYLLLELPRMELSSDFPIGVEKQVSANGLNPTTSYWFGQNPAAAEDDEADEANGDGQGEIPAGNEGSSPETGSNPVTAMK